MDYFAFMKKEQITQLKIAEANGKAFVTDEKNSTKDAKKRNRQEKKEKKKQDKFDKQEAGERQQKEIRGEQCVHSYLRFLAVRRPPVRRATHAKV